MVTLAVWSLGVLGTGAVLTLVSVVNWCFWMQSQHGELRSEVAELRVKYADFITTFNSVNASLNSLERKVDVLTSRIENARTP